MQENIGLDLLCKMPDLFAISNKDRDIAMLVYSILVCNSFPQRVVSKNLTKAQTLQFLDFSSLLKRDSMFC